MPAFFFPRTFHAADNAGGGASDTTAGDYGRMFALANPSPAKQTEDGLIKLGRAMTDKDPELEQENQPDLPTAGYTYLGQFIDHDLTLDLTPLNDARPDLTLMRNGRTPFLDLDNVYGGGPNVCPFLYEKGHRDAERLLIGKLRDDPTRSDDLPRNVQGIALTGDPRQDENLLLAQIHVVFLKLHNKIIADPAQLAGFRKRPEDSDFSAARRAVRWHYQWIVRHDYLQRILDETTFQKLPELESAKRSSLGQRFRMPIEFSVGAFRFGHSMVRDQYKTGVNQTHSNARLLDLLTQTGFMGGAAPALPVEWVVSWERFFEIRGQSVGQLNRARKIDTQIANTLFHLDSDPPELPVRTLLRGARVGLPFGEQVAKEVVQVASWVQPKPDAEIAEGSHRDILQDPQYDLAGKTPLWYYVLREAELHQNTNGQRGRSLGPVGSYIVANVILDALAADPDSYLSSPGWVPTLPTMGAAADRDSFSKILMYVA